jgi:threonine dehydrogenase-like Zn-dependent dehydrogenase
VRDDGGAAAPASPLHANDTLARYTDAHEFSNGEHVKAAVFQGVGLPLSVEDREDPRPGTGEVIIRVARCGICSSDLHMTSGHGFTYPAGTVLGHEYAGEVVETGPGVRKLQVGQRITALPLSFCGACESCRAGHPIGCAQMQSKMSGYAQYATVAEDSAVSLPSSVSLADGALVEPLASALRGISCLPPNVERVAVLGAGPIGLGAMFWARRRGIKGIAAIARSSRHRDLALAMGAGCYLTQGPELAHEVNAALGGPPQAVIECIGAPGALTAAIDLVAVRGSVISLGMCMQPDTVSPFMAGFKGISLHFSAAYALEHFEQAVRTLDAGAVEPRHMITDTIPLARLPAVFDVMREGAMGCKTLVAPWTDDGSRAS